MEDSNRAAMVPSKAVSAKSSNSEVFVRHYRSIPTEKVLCPMTRQFAATSDEGKRSTNIGRAAPNTMYKCIYARLIKQGEDPTEDDEIFCSLDGAVRRSGSVPTITVQQSAHARRALRSIPSVAMIGTIYQCR